MITRERVLSRQEIMTVLDYLRPRARRKNFSKNHSLNLAIFRLSCCCGLRVSEICQLRIKDLSLGGELPCIRLPARIVKGSAKADGTTKRKGRLVPLSWCHETRDDLVHWMKIRIAQGGQENDPFVCPFRRDWANKPFRRNILANRWKTCVRVLGPDRERCLSIHAGRHSFISHALHQGIPIPLVQAAAGHENIHTTSLYVHVLEGYQATGAMFASVPPPKVTFPRVAKTG